MTYKDTTPDPLKYTAQLSLISFFIMHPLSIAIAASSLTCFMNIKWFSDSFPKPEDYKIKANFPNTQSQNFISNNQKQASELISTKQCVVVNEASSSGAAIFVYEQNLMNQKKITFSTKIKGLKLDKVIEQGNYSVFFEEVFYNSGLHEYADNLRCSRLDWMLLSTGGMRNYEENGGVSKALNFYYEFEQFIISNQNYKGKKLVLKQARTITGAEEGKFAWKSYDQGNGCHAVIDLGGQTSQFASKDNVISKYIGKDRILQEMQDHILPCRSVNYDGEACRKNINDYFSTSSHFTEKMSFENYCKVYVVSNFHYYFNDVCDHFLPYLNTNSYDIDEEIHTKIQQACAIKKTNSLNFSVSVNDYIEYTDQICGKLKHEKLSDQESEDLLINFCASGNYNYQILKLFGAADDQLIYPAAIGWELGVVLDYMSQ